MLKKIFSGKVIALLVFLLTFSHATVTVYACGKGPTFVTEDRSSTCDPQNCSGTSYYDQYWTITYTDNSTCTELRYFTNSSCTTPGSSPCATTCSSDSECGEGTCASGTLTASQVCAGNRGPSPWYCQAYTCVTPITPTPTKTPTPVPTSIPTVAPSPTPTTSPDGYRCPISKGTEGSSSIGASISESGNYLHNGQNAFRETSWYRSGSLDAYDGNLNHTYQNLSPNTTYIIRAERYAPDLGVTRDCGSFTYTTGSPPTWVGTCGANGTSFSVTGSSGTSWATDSGGYVWQGESVPFTHSVTPDRSFTWYVDSNGDGSPESTLSQTCLGGSIPVQPTPPPPPVVETFSGTTVYIKYPDGTDYNGFGAPAGGLPIYTGEFDTDADYAGCPNPLTALKDSSNNPVLLNGQTSSLGWHNYGSCCAVREWSKSGYNYAHVGYNFDGTGKQGSVFGKLVWIQFPSSFLISQTLSGEGGAVECLPSTYSYDNGHPSLKNLASAHFNWPVPIFYGGWHPNLTVVARPGVSLTVNKTGSGQGTINGSFINTSEYPPLNCGTSCPSVTQTYYRTSAIKTENPAMALVAAPSSTSRFSGWSGCYSSNMADKSCTVYMDQSYAVSANFIATQTLNVSIVGSGTVTSGPPTPPPGITCPGTNCSTAFDQGTAVTLTANYNSATTIFSGWTGCTAVPGDPKKCTITMNTNKNVTATFTAVPPPTPQVTINSNPACSNYILTNPNSDITFSWINTGVPVTSVDISESPTFSTYYSKTVSSTSTTAPAGFRYYTTGWPNTPYLGIKPGTTYYVRLYNGVPTNGGHSLTPATLTIPTCGEPTACPLFTPTPTSPAWLKTVGGDVHSNR